LPDWQEQDVPGSPYAVADYTVSEALGGEAGLAAFRRKLKAKGLKLLLDFVPNHLGLDHPWLNDQPDLFVQSPSQTEGTFAQQTKTGQRWLAHGKDPYFAPWTDTVQLDYRRLAARARMTELLRSLATRCDGVRCDMAMLALNDVFNKTWGHLPAPEPAPSSEFWSSAISAVKKERPDFFFLGEAYWGLEGRLQELGFDFTYDKALYDALVGRDSAQVQRHLTGASPEFVKRSAHFLENHDEPRIASLLSIEEHRAAALVTLGLPGMAFLHDGQLTGARRKIPVQLSRRAVEPTQPEIKELYEVMLARLPKTAIGRGEATVLRPREAWPGNPTSQNFILVQWQAEPESFDLVVVNLAPHRGQCSAPLTVPNLSAHNWSLSDLLGSEQYLRSGQNLQNGGLFLDLAAHGAQLFHFQPAT
jgi:hypothetical protein